VSAVVIDASAGAEIISRTRRGRALARLLPAGTVGWVPEHFYAEVLGVLRRRLLIEQTITESEATAALARLRAWRLHHASVAPLVDAAWAYRHNMTAADALYVVLAEHLDADFLTDDHRLAASPTFPRVNVLRLPARP
jgi:predicted nucleic acid-binding protein